MLERSLTANTRHQGVSTLVCADGTWRCRMCPSAGRARRPLRAGLHQDAALGPSRAYLHEPAPWVPKDRPAGRGAGHRPQAARTARLDRGALGRRDGLTPGRPGPRGQSGARPQHVRLQRLARRVWGPPNSWSNQGVTGSKKSQLRNGCVFGREVWAAVGGGRSQPENAAGGAADFSGEKQPVYDLDDGIDVPGHEPERHDHQAYAKHRQTTADR